MRLPPKLPNGSTLRLSQAEGVLGGVIWPAAATLCRHLLQIERERSSSPPNRLALELGSGTGCVGLYFAAALKRNVILTEHRPPLAAALTSVAYNVDGTLDYNLLEGQDMPKSDILINLLHINVQQNRDLFETTTTSITRPPPNLKSMQESKVAQNFRPIVEELDWTKPDHADRILKTYNQHLENGGGFPLLFASDVTYISSLHAPLARTIATLLDRSSRPSSSPKCWIAHQERVVDLLGQDHQLNHFLEALEKENLQVTIQTASTAAAAAFETDPTTSDGSMEPKQSLEERKLLLHGSIKLLDIRHQQQ